MRKARCHEWIPALWRLTKLRRKENEQILQFESPLTYIDESQSYNWFMFSFILIMCRIQTDNVILSKWALRHLSWQTWFTFIVDVWRERMVIDVLVSERQCLWSQASLALAFLAHSMWLRAAGLAGAGQGARCWASRCKAAQNLKRLSLWRRNASQIAQLHWVI